MVGVHFLNQIVGISSRILDMHSTLRLLVSDRMLRFRSFSLILVSLAASFPASGCGPRPDPGSVIPPSSPRISPPTPVTGLEAACRGGVANVSTGWSHSCALCTTGEVACWGTNFLGNLGVPLPTERTTPAAIAGLKDVKEIAAGSYHTCARLASGEVTCWGANNDGQLGDDTSATRLHPVMVSGLAGATQLDVGFGPGHACAIVGSGHVWCWGVNFNSQLGDGTMTNRAAPIEVALDDATQISTGAYHTCALRRGGKVSCWGGKHGHERRPSTPVPRQVAGLEDAVQIAAGAEHTCALRKGGTVVCWGMNGAGQLGDGTWRDHEAPLEVRGLAEVTSISSASTHTCAILANATVRCWGANEHGQLGDGTTEPRNLPVVVPGLGDVAQVSTGHRTSCAQARSGQVSCWGELDRTDVASAETPPR
jgi:alpha-tubulin suppressor-like RCC1 family protein